MESGGALKKLKVVIYIVRVIFHSVKRMLLNFVFVSVNLLFLGNLVNYSR